ncbi:MAG: hypothetical protein P8J86_02125 [Phycisphaerales bacterium]|nr:hypothetical protein [Phycisphaerales bacterium]
MPSSLNRQHLTSAHWQLDAPEATELPPEVANALPIAATVPGCVHLDLLTAGLIEDPRHNQAEDDLAWIGRTAWRYQCDFDADPELHDQPQVDLVCEGLDTVAKVSVNGKPVGSAANMFHRHRFHITEALQSGRNQLTIEFESPVAYAQSLSEQLGPRPANFPWSPYNFIRKSACNFGWDWGPQVATSGIWRDLYLEGLSSARIDSVRPLITEASSTAATVDIHVRLDHRLKHNEPLQLKATATIQGKSVASKSMDCQHDASDHVITLDWLQPELWWPRGHGLQPLYDLHIELSQDSQVLDAWQGRLGVRQVELRQTPDQAGTSFALMVNGKEVFCQGANWIPEDLFPAAMTTQRYRQRIEQACDANMNMLRVWGGGIYEDDAFYDICDERGILVWQDFMFACATYPEDPPFEQLVKEEAIAAVCRLAAHPSVVLYCGSNECVWAYQSWGFADDLKPELSWGAGFYTHVLPDILAMWDPTRPYVPSTPWSGDLETHAQELDCGPRHNWDVEMAGYRTLLPRFVAEFGHQSPPNLATLQEAIDHDPHTLDHRWMEHRQRAAGGNLVRYEKPMAQVFTATDNFYVWHGQAQALQARSVSLGLSWNRCHSKICGGSLFWQLNDCWAGHSWSAIDVAGRLKPLWYAVRRVLAPRTLAVHDVNGQPVLFVINDEDETWSITLAGQRLDFDGREINSASLAIRIPPRTAEPVAALDSLLGQPDNPTNELLRIEGDGLETVWFFAADKALSYPEPQFDATVEHTNAGTLLWIKAHTLIRDIILRVDLVDPLATCSEQLVTLGPGQSHTFAITSDHKLQLSQLTTAPVFWHAQMS